MQKQKASIFKKLHDNRDCFIMPNAWNAGSAVLLEQAGFQALGTTSAGIAYSNACADSVSALSLAATLNATSEIATAVTLPVSMDSENLYTHEPDDIYQNIQKIVATGVVGASIEDYTGDSQQPFYDIELAVERVRAAKQAIAELNFPFILTARSECYLYGHAKPFAESVRRVNRYWEAGADCIYVPGIHNIATIRELVTAVEGPVNVVMGLSGTPVRLADLRAAGVARVSIGGSLARATMGLVRRAAREMLDHGSFEFAAGQIADAELCELFSSTGRRV